MSPAPWDSMNLGRHVGDCRHNVQVNRDRLQAAIGARPIFLNQVHGVEVIPLDASSQEGAQADACVTRQPLTACTIMVADCLPVLMCDASGQWVAAAHAGWRGLAAGVLENLLDASGVSNTERQGVLAWLGPCIGPQAFEVGAEVVAAFCDHDPQASHFFSPGALGKWWADLAGLARWRLHRLGVMQVFGNDGGREWCTATQTSRFFSHRRDSRLLGQSGRMAACIWLSD